MAYINKRRGRPKKVLPPQRKMKFVHVDHNTIIEVPVEVADEDAITRFNLKRRIGPHATGMALIALKEAEEEEEIVIPQIDLEVGETDEE